VNPEELKEGTEQAHEKGLKPIGLTMAVVAVLVTVALLLSHRAHTEEIKLQTKVNDGWQFYQAKHNRAYEFGLHAEDRVKAGAAESLVAAHEDGSSKEEKTEKETARKEGAVDIQEQTRDMEKETELIARRADFYDASELFLDISIVLCSIAILTLAKTYWRFSFITTAIGIGAAAWGWFLR